MRKACRPYSERVDPEKYIVPNTTSITCKQCLKAMGMLEEPTTRRFVVFDTESKKFFRTKAGCNNWSDDINDAFLFKKRSAAENI